MRVVITLVDVKSRTFRRVDPCLPVVHKLFRSGLRLRDDLRAMLSWLQSRTWKSTMRMKVHPAYARKLF